ncbi:MAG: MBL fold metallo-hydrolase [Thermoplasmata archaeon]|jgi:phosphoribosyl 1,2-cyclic phosphodiesterase|nr:MBL fold metallo-hydrolase [Thermoplasmata archaeon]
MMEVHVLASGSDGNCTVIESDGEAIMIDAGISCRRILSLMEKEGVDKDMLKAILITHEHSDHVSGAGATARKLDIPIVANEATFNASNLGNVQHWVYRSNNHIDIGQFHVTPLPTSHNAVEPNCYFTEVGDKRVLVCTDTGKFSFQIDHALSLADVAVVEANYDLDMLVNGPYPYSLKTLIGSDHGHMNNLDTAIALKRTMDGNAHRKIFLAHLSKTNNTPDTARQAVSDGTGIRRMKIDCLEFPGDTRTIKVD